MEHLPAQQQEPFSGRQLIPQTGLNAGAVAIEQERAIAEAQGQLALAKRFPRSMAQATQEFLESCASPDFAAMAFYSVPNRGSGPSIRFAEEAARCYGNFQYGHRELGRTPGKSEIEVFAWDMQNNNFRKRQITVLHVVDTKNGPKKLNDQADIDNRIANVASKQMRSCILALLPKHMLAAGQEACKRTLAGNGDKPMSQRIAAMVAAFSRFGVTTKHLERHLSHGVDDTTVDELADLMGIYNAIKEGARASEYFPADDEATGQNTAQAAAKAVSDIAAQSPAPAPAAKPAGRRNAAQTDGNAVKERAAESQQNAPQADPQPATAQKAAAKQQPSAEPPPEPELPPSVGVEDDVF